MLLSAVVAVGVLSAGCGSSQPPKPSKAPTIGGMPIYHSRPAGLQLTPSPAELLVRTGTWTHALTFTYQWEACDSSGANCSAITGATGDSHAIQASDVGHRIRVVVTAHNGKGSTSATSAVTAVVTIPGAPKVSYYVAQTSQGTGNGSSCANAEAVTTLSTSTEWRPGNVIGLCGTISSSLSAMGSGSAGSPITLYFEPGALMSQPAASTFLNLSNRSYITVNGGQNGVIENTANGTTLGNSASTVAIQATPCNGCTIENLTIRNIYVRTSISDESNGASNGACLVISGSNMTVANNTMDYAHWCLVDDAGPTDSNVRVYGNNISNTDHGIALAFNNTTGGPGLGPFYFYDNYVHDYAAWDSTTGAYHHDGFHCYHSQSSGYDLPYIGRGLYLYNNVFGGDLGTDNTAQLYLEGAPNGRGTGSLCSTPNSPIYIFNNVVETSSHPPNNEYFTLASGTDYIYNNTIAGNRDDCLSFNDADGGRATLENDLISGCNQEISNSGAYDGSMVPDYNLYGAGGSNAFSCNDKTYAFSAFSSWKSCIGGDSHSRTTSDAMVNSDGSLQNGSPAVGAGRNLYNICNGQPTPGLGALCENINGDPRPSSGAWNAGAY